MAVQQLLLGGLMGVIGILVSLFGLAMLIRGLSSARNAVLALVGSETAPADLDPDADTATVKLSGTVESVPDPVETVDGERAALYHLKAVAKNWRNLLSKRSDVKWLLAEGARLRRVVVGGDDAEWTVTADPLDDDRKWGGVQTDSSSGYGTALRRPDVGGAWTRKEKYSDASEVPADVVSFLEREYGADVDLDLSKRGLSLTVGETVVGEGDDLRVVGKVQPGGAGGDTSEATADAAVAADGGGPTVNLTPGATVTSDSWGALAWTEAKSAVKAPAGALLLGMGLFALAAMLDFLNVVSLGIY